MKNRDCPIPGYDIAIGDGVVWKGQPYFVNCLAYSDASGRRLAKLAAWLKDQQVSDNTFAPLDDLKVFKDANWLSADDAPAWRDS